MREISFAIALAGLAITGFVPQQLSAQDTLRIDARSVESEVLAVMAEMREAAESLDAEALYAHVVDTSTPPIIEDGRMALTRSEALQATLQGLRGLDSLAYTYEYQTATVLSATLALCIGAGSATAKLADGRTISAPFAETIVFSRQYGQWMVLHAHRSAPDQ